MLYIKLFIVSFFLTLPICAQMDCKSCVTQFYSDIFSKNKKTVLIDNQQYPCERFGVMHGKKKIFDAIDKGLVMPLWREDNDSIIVINVQGKYLRFFIKKYSVNNKSRQMPAKSNKRLRVSYVEDLWSQKLYAEDYEVYTDLRDRTCNGALKKLVSYLFSYGVDRNHYFPFGNKFKKMIGKSSKDDVFASIDNAMVYSLPYYYKSDSLYVVKLNGKPFFVQLYLRMEQYEMEGAPTREEVEKFYSQALWCVRHIYDADGIPFDEKSPLYNNLYGYLLIPAIIQDKDGYVNVREGKSSSSKVIGKLTDKQPFFYTPSFNSEWWRVTLMTPHEDIEFYGYVHKSRILSYNQCSNDMKQKLYDYFKYCLCW